MVKLLRNLFAHIIRSVTRRNKIKSLIKYYVLIRIIYLFIFGGLFLNKDCYVSDSK